MSSTWVEVANVEIDSRAGTATITLQRNWMYNEARLDDLPSDFREALRAWLAEHVDAEIVEEGSGA